MRVLGIDPGYERLGVAVLEKTNGKEMVVYSECFKTPTSLNFSERLVMLGNRVREIIAEYKPELLAIETLFLNTNQKTAMRVSEARGVVMYEAALSGLPIFEASPPQIKMATAGYGRASKAEIIKMVKMLLNIKEKKNSDDELDAMAIAITALAHNRK